MRQIWIPTFLLVFVFSVSGASQHGKCDQYQYTTAVQTCQAALFRSRRLSPNPELDCPDFYEQAVKCLRNSIINRCYANLKDESRFNESMGRILGQFGDEDYYCKYGTLPPIAPLIFGNEKVKCVESVNETAVRSCENPFYDLFDSDPASDQLCALSTKTAECQMKFRRLCHIALEATLIPNTAHMSNVLCHNLQDKLAGAQNRNNGTPDPSEVHHPTSWDVIIPVIVIAVLALLALTVGFCHYAKQERRKNKKQNRENKKKISEKILQRNKNGTGSESKPQAQEMQPLSSVLTQEKEDISQV